ERAAVVAARKEMRVAVRSQRDGRMPEPLLHQLERQFQPAVLLLVDAPRSEEMSEAMQAGVFWPAILGHDASGDLRREEPARENVLIDRDRAAPRREREAEFTLRALQPPLAQLAGQRWRQRHRPLALAALGPAYRAKAVGSLPNVQLALLEVDVLPTKPSQFRSAQPRADRGQ